jgi:peptidoglycan/LPS O-acetylase OafA/YrhL
VSARIPHLPALDGLRGLALAGVLLFHADGLLVGGYLGVDLFFVLSGYLITSLLVCEHAQTGRIDLGAFWLRRVRRLFPALLAMLFVLLGYVAWLAQPSEYLDLRAEALATLGYVANWRSIWSEQSYWDLFSAPSVLEHTWSLSIEEQFYVVWPLVTWALLKRSKRALWSTTLLLCGASMLAMTFLYDPSNSSRAYLGTDTRAAAILFGAAFALWFAPDRELSRRAARGLNYLGTLALLFLGVCWWRLDGDDRLLYRGGFWLTELAALVLIACAVSAKQGWVARLLSRPLLTWLGRVSYGAYLWHWPVNVVLSAEHLGLSGLALQASRLALTFTIAAVSYRYLEQPIRRHGLPWGRPWVVAPATVLTTIALWVYATSGAPPALSQARAAEAVRPAPPGDWHLLVLGDSTANALGWVVRGLHLSDVSVTLGGIDGFSLHNDEGDRWKPWSEVVEQARPDATVVVLGGAFLYGINADGGWRAACYPAWDESLESRLTKRLLDLKSGTGPLWVATVPYALGRYDNEKYRGRIDCVNAVVRRTVEAVGGFQIWDLAEVQCPKGACLREFQGEEMRPDGVHYRIDAARPIGQSALALMRRDAHGSSKQTLQ